MQGTSERGDAWGAVSIFCGVALAFAAVYLGSALLFGGLSVFQDPNGRFGLVRLARFNAALGLVLAYLCASLWLGQRWMRRGFPVRIEQPEALARWVLRDQLEWSPERIAAALADPHETRVAVRSPILVLLLYATVQARSDGSISFYEDLYGHDAELERTLARDHP